jgi:two-component system KDP operon response regulator KdpE
MKILIADDDRDLLGLIAFTLTQAGYLVVKANDGPAAIHAFQGESPDLAVLDINMPGASGFQVCEAIRAKSRIPVMMLTVRGEEEDLIKALDLGADDYLTKPFSTGELLARIRAALRHASRVNGETAATTYEVGDLKVDLSTRRIFRGGNEVHLTPIEFKLLTTMIHSAGKVLTHRQLLKDVWGPQQVAETHYLRVFMANLRRKLEADPAQPRYLLTEQGIGYRMAAE